MASKTFPADQKLNESWQAATDSILGPWSTAMQICITIDCTKSDERQAKATIESIMASTYQNFSIVAVISNEDSFSELGKWVSSDSRVTIMDKLPTKYPAEGFALLINAGIIFTRYSIEALVNAIISKPIATLRIIVEGSGGSMEMWRNSFLSKPKEWSSLERRIRSQGLEKWISSKELGIHSFGLPAPRLFIRRGVADQHIMDIVIHETRSEAFQDKHSTELRKLELKNNELRRLLEHEHSNIMRRFITRARRIIPKK